MLAKKGTFAFPNSSANLPVTGVGFQPKVVFFWLTKQSATGYAAERALCFGWAVSSTQRGCLALSSADAVTVGTAVGSRQKDTFCISAISTAAGSVSTILDADFVSMDSDGFTIDPINVSVGALYIVHYLALGGSELTNAWAGNIVGPAGTGAQAYTGVGFKPDLLMLLTSYTGTIPRDDTAFKLNLGVSDGVTQAVSFVEESNAIPTALNSLQKTGEILHTLNLAGTDNSIATLTSLDTDGFTLNFSLNAGARGILALALKGSGFKVSTDTQKTSTGTKAKTGVGFRPQALFLFGTNRASSASVDATLASLSIGASDGVSEGGTWNGSTDNVSTTDENSATVTDKILRHATNPSTTNAEADLFSLDVDGYTLDWTTADATAREFIAVSFKANPGATQLLAPSADSVDGTWTDQGGGTALAAAIDELTPSDSDYIQSVSAPSNAGCRVKLATGSDPSASTGHIIHWRVQRSGSGTLGMTVVLKQGGGNSLGAGTTIASFTRNSIGVGFSTFDETLSGAQADAITDYADLYLEFYATGT